MVFEEIIYAIRWFEWKFKSFYNKYPRLIKYTLLLPASLMEHAFGTVNTVFSMLISYIALAMRYYVGIKAAKFFAAAANITMSLLMLFPTYLAVSFTQAFLLTGAGLLFGPAGVQAMQLLMYGSAVIVQVALAVLSRSGDALLSDPLESTALSLSAMFNMAMYYSSYEILVDRLEARDFFDESNSTINEAWDVHSEIKRNGPLIIFFANFAPLIVVAVGAFATVGQAALHVYVNISERVDSYLRLRRLRSANPSMTEQDLQEQIAVEQEQSRQISASVRIAQIRQEAQNRIANALQHIDELQRQDPTVQGQTTALVFSDAERQLVEAYERTLAAAVLIQNSGNIDEISDAELQTAQRTFARQAEEIVNIIPHDLLRMRAQFNSAQERLEELAAEMGRLDEVTQPQQYSAVKRQIYTVKLSMHELKQDMTGLSEAAKTTLKLQSQYNRYSTSNFWSIDPEKRIKIETDYPAIVSELGSALMVIPGHVEQINPEGEVVATFKMDLFEFLELLATSGKHPITRKNLTIQDFIFDYKDYKQLQHLKSQVVGAEDQQLDVTAKTDNSQLFTFDRICKAAESTFNCVTNTPNRARDYVRSSRFNTNPYYDEHGPTMSRFMRVRNRQLLF